MSRTVANFDNSQYRAANEASARLILADVARYGGDGAALVVWARMVLGEMTQKEKDNG